MRCWGHCAAPEFWPHERPSNEMSHDLPPDRLGGEADPRSWFFNRVGEEGPLPNPTGHTFPLISHDLAGRCRVVGTGFYVNDEGMFVTARHVVEEVMRGDVQVAPLVALHLHSPTGLFGPSECIVRPIVQCWLGDPADVALGYAAIRTNAAGERLKHWAWTLSWRVPDTNSIAATYAFPNSAVSADGRRIRLAPDAYMGRVQGSGNFRDTVVMPFPFIQVDCRIHGAASGGPLLSGDRLSDVVAINCTEYVADGDNPAGPAFGVQSKCLAEAYLEDLALPGETRPRLVTFDEMVSARIVNIANYQPRDPDRPRQGRVVRPNMRYTAPLPSVEVAVHV
jgi:hypothetical protein